MKDTILEVDLSPIKQDFKDIKGLSDDAAKQFSSNAQNEWSVAGNLIKEKLADIRDSLNMGEWFSDIPRAIIDWFGPDVPKRPVIPDMPQYPNVQPQDVAPATQPPSNYQPGKSPLLLPFDGQGDSGYPRDWQAGYPSATSGPMSTEPQFAYINAIAEAFGLEMTSGLRDTHTFHGPGESGLAEAGNFSGDPADMLAFSKYMAQN